MLVTRFVTILGPQRVAVCSKALILDRGWPRVATAALGWYLFCLLAEWLSKMTQPHSAKTEEGGEGGARCSGAETQLLIHLHLFDMARTFVTQLLIRLHLFDTARTFVKNYYGSHNRFLHCFSRRQMVSVQISSERRPGLIT